jgi:hypothetical protein
MAREKGQQAGFEGLLGVPDLGHLDWKGALGRGHPLDPIAVAITPDPARPSLIVLAPQKRRHFLFQQFLDHPLGS